MKDHESRADLGKFGSKYQSSYDVFPSGQTMETIVTYGLWGGGDNNVWSNLMNVVKGAVM